MGIYPVAAVADLHAYPQIAVDLQISGLGGDADAPGVGAVHQSKHGGAERCDQLFHGDLGVGATAAREIQTEAIPVCHVASQGVINTAVEHLIVGLGLPEGGDIGLSGHKQAGGSDEVIPLKGKTDTSVGADAGSDVCHDGMILFKTHRLVHRLMNGGHPASTGSLDILYGNGHAARGIRAVSPAPVL